MRTILLFLIPMLTLAQQDVPDEYWIDDSSFDEVISPVSYTHLTLPTTPYV